MSETETEDRIDVRYFVEISLPVVDGEVESPGESEIQMAIYRGVKSIDAEASIYVERVP